jgi:EAL domain-containing protein (putative c-di-GMP-specific phosphodiesterase class I)
VVSVNVAVQQLRHGTLVANVREVLDRTGLPAQALQLEITESAVIDTHAETIATLRALADLGVRLALDDFGTGYANLAILPALPLHVLKLAAPFVNGAAEYNDAFLRAVTELGHTLGLTVTAEGLETQAEAERLRAIGCDTGQGWYFGRPMPPDQLARAYL